jgi:hypothetical protein
VRFSRDKLIIAGASTATLAIYFFLDLFVFASSHSLFGSFGLGLLCTISLCALALGPTASTFMPYRRQEDRTSAVLVALLPALTMMAYMPLSRVLDLDATARIQRYGVHEYSHFSDLRSSFHGLLRVLDARINAPLSMYYPPDDEFQGEIYYVIENSNGALEGIYIDSVFTRQQEFIDSVGDDNRLNRPLSGFITTESGEIDRCSGVLHDGAIKHGWQNTDAALCLIYVPAVPEFIRHGKLAFWLLLPAFILVHFLACFWILRHVR